MVPFRAFLLLLLLSLLVFSGCIDYHERVRIDRDGSAVIALELRVSSAFQGMLASQPAFQSLALLMNEEALKAALPPGLVLRSHTHTATSGRQIYRNEIYVPDVRSIRAADSPVFSNQRFAVEKNDDGSLTYQRHIDFTSSAQDPEVARMMAENRLAVMAVLRSATFQFEVAAPLTLLSTNGRAAKGGAVWEYTLHELMNRPVTQEMVLAPPGLMDILLGAAFKIFRPAIFPVMALFLLGLFFLLSYRRPSVNREQPGAAPVG